MPQVHPSIEEAFLWRKLFLSKDKLKASSRTSALLSGFAMVGMVEVHFDEHLPKPLLVAFSICTTLLVSVHILALMISTCILPHIEAISNVREASILKESPHERLRLYIDMAWVFSTGFGTILFLAEIALLLWVKFHRLSLISSVAGTVIVVPAAILFVVFGFHFYKRLIVHKLKENSKNIEELEHMAEQLARSRDDLSNGTCTIQIV